MDELTEKGEQYPLDLAGVQQRKMLAEEDAARYHVRLRLAYE